MQCCCFLSRGLNFLQKDPSRASRSRLYTSKAADSCRHSRAQWPRRCLCPLGRVTGLPPMSLTWVRGRAETHHHPEPKESYGDIPSREGPQPYDCRKWYQEEALSHAFVPTQEEDLLSTSTASAKTFP